MEDHTSRFPAARETGAVGNLLRAALRRAPGVIRPGDILAAALDSGQVGLLIPLASSLRGSGTLQDLRHSLDRHWPPAKEDADAGGEATLSIEVGRAYDRFQQLGDGRNGSAVSWFLSHVLEELGDEDRDALGELEVREAIGRLRTTDEEPVGSANPTPCLEMACGLLSCEDLTAEALYGRIEPAVTISCSDPQGDGGARNDPYESISRALYRRLHPHALITGWKGVGKTTVVRELARRAAAGDIPFLADARFLRLDCGNVAPEDSRAVLTGVFSSVTGRREVVLCLDGLGALLKRPMGGDNRHLLRGALESSSVRMIGVLSRWDFHDLIAGDAEMLETFTRVEIDEPPEDRSLEIVRQVAGQFEKEFGLSIDQRVPERAVVLSANYILSERLPAKAISIVRHVCEDADYDRAQLGKQNAAVTVSGVVDVVSGRTGIPPETLTGEAGRGDFAAALAAEVVGQKEAVGAVADELRLIKAGLTEPGKPAAVLLFAGMTGVGKTELAKRVAELYSSSRLLQTYAMGNFTEPHSVSGIIGVPPGYVGHDQGGRLINELNADPYSVFLLDEAEKAHPNVWKPFLNLFDEGWITDQRGVKAYADRAIFILTTNAGEKAIAQLSRSGRSDEEMIEKVKQALARVKHEKSSQPVFTPQMLARIGRVIVFNPLDESAMIGISRKMIDRMQRLWQRKREKRIAVPDDLIEHIGRTCHALNDKSSGKEGGRIVRRKIADLIEGRIQHEAVERRDEYARCSTIELYWNQGSTTEIGDDSRSRVDVEFRTT